VALARAFCVLAPWLAVLPLHGALAVLAQAALFVAAAHGAGQVTAALAGRERPHPLLAFQLGLATLIAVAGVAIALGIATVAMQLSIACSFAGVHSAILVARWHEVPAERSRAWLAPAVLLGALAIVHVLGAAGDVGARPFDDDGHVLGQLQRLRDTGGLGDGTGYARASQLGGQLALTALATVPGDVHLARVLEALAFTGAIGLAIARIRPRDAASALWAVMVVVGASALAFAPLDLAACWTIVGLVLALHALLDDAQPHPGLVALVAGALMTLRIELAPLALAAIARTWWPLRREPRAAWAIVLGVLVAAVPLMLARHGAAPSDEIRRLIGTAGGRSLGRIAVFAALAVPAGAFVAFAFRRSAQRWLAIGAALTLLAITTGALGERAYAMRLLWPLGIAAGLALAIQLSRAVTLTVAAMLASVVLLVLVYEGREATGRTRWTRRYLELAQSIEYVRHTGTDTPVAGGYAVLLAKVPRGATVAIWVARPERLDYRAHRFVDLRTPRAARLRIHRFDAHTSRMAALVAATGAQYLLLEEDLRGALRIRESWHQRFVCSAWSPACADDLETLVLDHRVVATDRGVRLVELRR